MKRNKFFNKKSRKYLRAAVGTPLAYGTLAFVSGKLPSTMGSTMSSALAPASGMVGVVSKVAMLGWGYHTVKKTLPLKEMKRLKIKSKYRRLI